MAWKSIRCMMMMMMMMLMMKRKALLYLMQLLHWCRMITVIMKKALRETQTLRAGCRKAEPKFSPRRRPASRWARDGQNLISRRWQLPLLTNPVICTVNNGKIRVLHTTFSVQFNVHVVQISSMCYRGYYPRHCYRIYADAEKKHFLLYSFMSICFFFVYTRWRNNEVSFRRQIKQYKEVVGVIIFLTHLGPVCGVGWPIWLQKCYHWTLFGQLVNHVLDVALYPEDGDENL